MDSTPQYVSNIVKRNKELWALKKKNPQLFRKTLSAWETSIAERLKKLRGNTSQKPLISIVIPARNEEAYILPTLESIAAQKNVKGVEVLVIANNCTPGDMTAEISRKTGVRVYEYNYADHKIKPIALARQMGLVFLEGELYVSTDADTIAMPHWLEKLSHTLLSNPENAVVTSHSHMYGREKDKKIHSNDFQRAFIRKALQWTGLTGIGHNSFFHRKDAEEIGGYSMRFYPGEDAYISFRLSTLRMKKVAFVHDTDAEVWVSPRRVVKYGGYLFLANFFKIYSSYNGEQLNAREKISA
jgi:glycosyltransferase involved in cell wall biosynthesis